MTVIEHAIAVLEVGGDMKDQSSTAVSSGGNGRVTRAKKVLAVQQDIKDASESETDEDDDKESDRDSSGSQSEDEESDRRDSGAEAEEPEEVDYEKQRQQNILRNQQLMMELGLQPISIRREFPIPVRPSRDKSRDDEDYTEEREYPKVRAKKRMRIPKPAYQPVQTRASKRIRGEPAKEYKVDLEALENGLQLDLNGKDQSELSTLPPAQPGSYSKKQRWMGRKQTTGYNVEVELPCACAPLTLGSIATTIWDIGKIYKGKENRLKYWSGKGSMFRHPYPIGFRAEKHVFRERYTMHIKEGPDGPIFVVESEGGKVFEGSSPTLPWTKVCLASYSKGTRISGPLFFGFSDPITQKMIEELEGYQNWETVSSEERAKVEAKAESASEAPNPDS